MSRDGWHKDPPRLRSDTSETLSKGRVLPRKKIEGAAGRVCRGRGVEACSHQSFHVTGIVLLRCSGRLAGPRHTSNLAIAPTPRFAEGGRYYYSADNRIIFVPPKLQVAAQKCTVL